MLCFVHNKILIYLWWNLTLHIIFSAVHFCYNLKLVGGDFFFVAYSFEIVLLNIINSNICLQSSTVATDGYHTSYGRYTKMYYYFLL